MATRVDAPQSEHDVRHTRDTEFAAIVSAHATFLYRVAFNLLRHPQDAEDAVQECFLKLYRGESWREMEDAKAFLARTVWRIGLDRLGKNGGKAMRHAEDVTELEIATDGESPEQQAVGAGQRALLRRLIDGLDEGLRAPLLLSAIEGMTSAEVAAILGIPEGTVRTRLMRARTELKRRLATHGKETRR